MIRESKLDVSEISRLGEELMFDLCCHLRVDPCEKGNAVERDDSMQLFILGVCAFDQNQGADRVI